MKQLIFERGEQSSRSKQKKAAKKLQSERDSQVEQDSDADTFTKQPRKKVATQPNLMRKRSEASEQTKTSGQNPSKRQKSQVSFLRLDSDSGSMIDVESMAKDVHSPSHLPKVGTKRRQPKPKVKSKSKSTPVISVSPKVQTSSSGSGSNSKKPGKPTEVSTPKQKKQPASLLYLQVVKVRFYKAPSTPLHTMSMLLRIPPLPPVVYRPLRSTSGCLQKVNLKQSLGTDVN